MTVSDTGSGWSMRTAYVTEITYTPTDGLKNYEVNIIARLCYTGQYQSFYSTILEPFGTTNFRTINTLEGWAGEGFNGFVIDGNCADLKYGALSGNYKIKRMGDFIGLDHNTALVKTNTNLMTAGTLSGLTQSNHSGYGILYSKNSTSYPINGVSITSIKIMTTYINGNGIPKVRNGSVFKIREVL
jgi:hypothetical protein